ncbi:MAG: FAD-dependent oxidoreductase, partial [Methanobacteriaceae archaeon]|nr:FAD-dependent oxidoreductase [Methanobacteriaceae archaeon]
MNIVVIGAGAGGLTTASNIRRNDKDSQIIVITQDKNIAYSPCAIPYVIGGEINDFDKIIMHKPEEYMKKNIRVLTEATVTIIDKRNNEVVITKGKQTQRVKYDKLVIATGGEPLVPPIKGTDLENVFTIRTIEDGKKVQKQAKESKKIVLLGGGAIGLELGYELAQKGKEVTLVEMKPQIFPRSFDPDMADKIKEKLEEHKIKILTSTTIQTINGDKQVESVTINDEKVPVDMVILSTGVRPQTKLAEKIGCKRGKFALKTDIHMQTTQENVYAVGDCVEVVDAITNEKTLSPLGTTAVRQGIVAAKNITGIEAEFKPVLNSTVSKIGDYEIGAVGYTEAIAKANKIEIITSKMETLTRARYYPGSKSLTIKLITKTDGTIIGCQMFSKEAVSERIDAMTIIISQKLKCQDVVSLEFSYTPPLSTVIDPIVNVAESIIQKMSKKEDNSKKEEDSKK